jgi:hypothetical protein
MGKFSAAPTRKKPDDTPTAEDFISGANEVAQAGTLPWENLDSVRRHSPFNLRLTDAERAKLKFISDNTPDSMHDFCIKIISPAIDEKVKALLKKMGTNE